MAEKKSVKKEKIDDDSKLFAFLAVFLSIIGFVIAIIAKKDNKYVMYYAKQSLVLFIAYIILSVASTILTIVSLGILFFLPLIVYVLFIILWIVQIVYSLSGEMKETPVIGKFADKINL